MTTTETQNESTHCWIQELETYSMKNILFDTVELVNNLTEIRKYIIGNLEYYIVMMDGKTNVLTKVQVMILYDYSKHLCT